MKITLQIVLMSALSILAQSAIAQTTADSSAPSSTAQAAPPAPPAPAPAPASPPADVPPPPPGKGQIIFYRGWNYMGAADWIKIRENGQELGKLYGGHYFVHVADPGDHSYTVAMETTDTLKLEVDPGETYYVDARVGMGFMLYRFSLAPVDQATFDKSLPHLTPVPATPLASAGPATAGSASQ